MYSRPTTPSKENAFAYAGARLSFQKRVDENSRPTSPQKSPVKPPSTKSATPSINLRTENKEHGSNGTPEIKQGSSQTRPVTDSLHRSQSVGALQAATIAARRQNQKLQLTPPRDCSSEVLRSAIRHSQPQGSLERTESTEPVNLAAKTSVQRSNTLPSERVEKVSSVADLSQPALIAATANKDRVKTTDNTKARADTVSSFAMKSSFSITQSKPSTVDESSPQRSSIIAARSVSNQRQDTAPATKADMESKFGVILSRSVSPSPDRLGNVSPKKFVHPLYQNPPAALSEPTLSHNILDPLQSPRKVYKQSPLRATFGSRDSSSNSSLADSGALTAVYSRTTSAASLPILSSDKVISDDMPVSRRRPVHLKSTMRDDRKPRHEKGKAHIQSGPTSITEQERKRYEGLWASNRVKKAFSLVIGEDNYIENLVVRELWMRSNLSRDLLGHIWYFPWLRC